MSAPDRSSFHKAPPIGFGTFALSASLLAGLVCTHALADDAVVTSDSAPLLITLGSYGVYAPRFEGSKRHDVSPWPIISWRQAGDREGLDLPTDGIDYAVIETTNFRAGPVGFWRWQRSTSALLPRGFSHVGHSRSSIGLSLEAGLFAEYWPADWLRTRIEAREAFIGARGIVANLSADLVWRPRSELTLAAGPRLSLADREFMDDYYGVSTSQSQTSGLPVYKPASGIRTVGLGAYAKYKFTPNWSDYQQIVGQAGDSPVITSRGSTEQMMLGLGLSYTFKSPW
jgi:MipA family protein